MTAFKEVDPTHFNTEPGRYQGKEERNPLYQPHFTIAQGIDSGETRSQGILLTSQSSIHTDPTHLVSSHLLPQASSRPFQHNSTPT
jgi:hypothetical protein